MKIILLFIFILFLTHSYQFYNKDDEDKFICNDETCPPEQGECIQNLCLCAPGYTTFYKDNIYENKPFCNYSFKYKKWAIWLELIMPFGIGHFYCKRYLHGLMKFTIFWFLSFVKVIFKKQVRAYPEILKISQLLLWLFGILYVADYLGFTVDFYLDGNNMKIL